MAHLLRQSHVLVGATLVVAACADPLDLFGVEEVVTNRSQAQKPPAIADDKIEDKHPVYDPALVITETFDSCEVTLNKSASVTKLDVLPWGKGDGALNKIFPTRTAALEALGDRPVMPSMEIINGALKPFDDGLYAAVELAAESGADGALIDKAALLRDLLAELVTRASGGAAAEQPLARVAATQLGAAMLAGGESPTLPSGVEGDAQALLAVFNTDLRSRPIGFYTWTPELASIFRRDRLLQSPDSVRPDFGAFAETALILNQVPAIAVRYTAALDLYAGLTNPYFNLPPTALMPLVPDSSALANLSAIKGQFSSQHPETQGSASCAAHLAFLPASDSPETKLFRDLYCDKEIPGDQNLIDILIDRIRSGAVDLTPSATSGWYDRQLHALETLLVPERAPEKDHLFLTKRYKEKLIETFKSLITQHRETHVKQLDLGSSDDEGAGAPVLVDVYPKLPIEPFPTFYLRTARAYRFLQGILRASMGQAFLDQSARVLEGGSRSQVKLGDELEDKITLCYGLYAVAARSIGMRPEVEAAEVDLDAAETAARSWLTNWRNDTDIARDPRVIVPVEHDKVRHTVRYWAILGVKPLRIQAQFYPKFEPKILSAGYCQFRSFVDTRPYTLVEQQVELSLAEDSPPPTRDEFRAIADQHDNVADIVAALESR